MGMSLPIADIQTVDDTGPDILTEAASKLAGMDTFTANWARNTALDEMESRGGPKMSPDELNKKYPNVEKPWTQPTSELVAFHLNEEGAQRNKLKQAMSEAPGSGFYKGTVNFSQGLLAHAMDPVEFGVGAFAAPIISGAAGSVAARTAGGLSAAASVVAKGTGLGFDVAEGIIGNAALEPYQYSSAQRAQVDYSVSDSIISTIGGGAAFPLLKFGGVKAFSGLKNLPASTTLTAIKNGLGQIYSGKKPDISLARDTFDEIKFGGPKEGTVTGKVRSDYTFAPKTTEEFKSSPVFMASKQAGTLEGGTKIVSSESFGEGGLYGTDNPHHANATAAHSLDTDGPNGDIFQARLDDLNLLDITSKNKELIESLELPDDLKALVGDAQTIKEALDNIKSSEPVEPKLRDVYHGTNTLFDELDYDQGGGLVHFAETTDMANRYAQDTGSGGRKGLSKDEVYIKTDKDEILTYKDKNWTKEDGTIVDKDIINENLQDFSYTYEPKNARVISKKINIDKVLDTKTDKGLRELLDILKPTNKRIERFIREIKDELNKVPGAPGFGNTFWSTTKMAKGEEINASLKEFTKQLKGAGYEGIRFQDDMHPTIAAFDNAFKTPKTTDELAEEFIGSIKAQGIDGLHFTEADNTHNAFHVFPESVEKVKHEGMYKSDVSAVKTPNLDKLEAFQSKVMSPENEIHFDNDLKKEMDNFVSTEDKDIELESTKTYDETIKVLDDLEKAGVITDKKDLAAIKAVKETRMIGQKKVKYIEDFVNCVISGVE